MSAFESAWILLKELSPSAQIMQDNAREALENRDTGYFQPNSHRFLGNRELYQPVQRVRPSGPVAQRPAQKKLPPTRQEMDENTYQTTLPQFTRNQNRQEQYPQYTPELYNALMGLQQPNDQSKAIPRG